MDEEHKEGAPLPERATEVDSDLSTLLDQALSDVVEGMSEEEATAYIASLFAEGEVDTEHSLFAYVDPRGAEQHGRDKLPARSGHARGLARPEGPVEARHRGELFYLASNTLEVYLGTREHPLELPQALKQIRQLSESTVLTGRILLGLWNIRRYNHRVSKNGSVAVLLEEILQWQGIQKHSRVAHPGTTKRYTDGYRTEQKQRVIQDLVLLASCNVRGTCTITVKGKSAAIEVDGPYMRYSVVSRKTGPGGEEYHRLSHLAR